MDERVVVNQRLWDQMAELHVVTYGIDDRDASGEFRLKPFEQDELGDITGQRVCHLQCHIGDDSFALAQAGAAEVIGVDFSSHALDIARMRSERVGLGDRVTFVRAAVGDAAETLGAAFDGVYTSWGVLCWLPDIQTWADNVSGLLRPGGWLYLADTHPYAAAARWESYAYGGSTAMYDDSQGDYTDAHATFEHPESWEWNHGIGEIVTALVRAGMTVQWLDEHPVAAWHMDDREHLIERPDGMWEQPGSTLPLSFSLRAIRASQSATL